MRIPDRSESPLLRDRRFRFSRFSLRKWSISRDENRFPVCLDWMNAGPEVCHVNKTPPPEKAAIATYESHWLLSQHKQAARLWQSRRRSIKPADADFPFLCVAIGRLRPLQMFPVMISATQTFKTHVALFHSHKSDQASKTKQAVCFVSPTATPVFIGNYIFPLMTRRSSIFQLFILSAFQIRVSAWEGTCTGATRALHPRPSNRNKLEWLRGVINFFLAGNCNRARIHFQLAADLSEGWLNAASKQIVD